MIIMQFEESKHPRDGDGKFTDKGGGEAKRVFELADELGVPYDRNTSYQTVKARVEEAQKNEVVELSDDNELARLIASSDENKYKVIKDYLVQNFAGRTFELSDGEKAIIDNGDAKELSHGANTKKTAELSQLKDLLKTAKFNNQANSVSHKRFDKFKYYIMKTSYRGKRYDLWLNVGHHKFDDKWHIYAITPKDK